MAESWQADQTCNIPDQEPGLWVGPAPTSSPFVSCWRMWRGWPFSAKPAGSPRYKAKPRYSRGFPVRAPYRQYNRNQRPWSRLFAMNICNQDIQTKGYIVWHTFTLYFSQQNSFFFFFLKFYFILFCGRDGKGRGRTLRRGQMSGIEMYDVKVTKNK